MSEDLEPIEKEKNPCQTFYLPSSSGEVHRYYRKSEADAVLAEKDKEIRRLHRALYKACANWAWAEHVRYVDISDGSQGYKQAQERWEKMARKCIHKAGESK